MPEATNWVTSHPLAAYAVLAVALSWAWWLPLALGTDDVRAGVGWPTHLPGLAGPALAVLIVTAIASGTAGLREVGSRLTRWQVGRWWLTVPAILLAGAAALLASGGVEDAADLTSYNGLPSSLGPLATIAVVLVVNGIGEELGWRGFVADRLLQRHGVVLTALLTTAVWAPWHAPLFFLVDSFEAFSPPELIGWTLGLASGAIVLTWIYARSGRSVLLVAAWHTAFNFTSATPAANGAVAATTSTLVMFAALAIVVAEWRSRPARPHRGAMPRIGASPNPRARR
ncbi:MAG: CPBP family intramembrane glutamic endopeptidase [Dehalococcoidia bacterium]